MVLPEEERAAGVYRAPPELVRGAHVPSLEKYRELYRRSVEEPQGECQARPGSAAAGGARAFPGQVQSKPPGPRRSQPALPGRGQGGREQPREAELRQGKPKSLGMGLRSAASRPLPCARLGASLSESSPGVSALFACLRCERVREALCPFLARVHHMPTAQEGLHSSCCRLSPRVCR